MRFKNFKNKRILITGFNGFKGAWLSIWLSHLGAKLYGISLKNSDKNNHYNLVRKNINLKEFYIDIRDRKKLKKTILKIKPDFVFHLAAQSIVYKSIKKPSFNWETNVIGFLNILLSLSELKKKCVGVLITSDKCYKNLERLKGYSEDDILGGEDPYSASKASSEILFNSFFKTFILNKNPYLRVATARAGNVIGGGDWTQMRLIPDCMKKWLYNKTVIIRKPKATRPWQHVLEALNGYLLLASKMSSSKRLNGESFNFSSNKIKNESVINFIKNIKLLWPNIKWKVIKEKKFHESKLLQLNNTKAKKKLKWSAKLNLKETIVYLVDWYKKFNINKDLIYDTSIEQIKSFENKQ